MANEKTNYDSELETIRLNWEIRAAREAQTLKNIGQAIVWLFVLGLIYSGYNDGIEHTYGGFM